MSTTTNTTTKAKASRSKAKAAERSVTPVTDVRSEATALLRDVESGKVTGREALAGVTRLDNLTAKANVVDTVWTLRVLGAIAVKANTEAKAVKGQGKAAPGAQAIANWFVGTPDGKASGRAAGSVKQAIDVYRVPDLDAQVESWYRFATGDDDKVKASDPKAYALNVQAFLRWNAAAKAGRIAPTGVVYASREAAKADGPTAADRSAESSDKAKAKATKVRAHARREAKASDAKIGAVRVADVAAMTTAQRRKLRDLCVELGV